MTSSNYLEIKEGLRKGTSKFINMLEWLKSHDVKLLFNNYDNICL